MKKIILLTAVLSAIVLSGCSNTQNLQNTQSPDDAQKPQQEAQDVQLPQSNIVWESQPKGDFAVDNRNPADVCKQIQTEQNLNNCTLVASMSANTDSECVDGKSVAGCFACKFSCP